MSDREKLSKALLEKFGMKNQMKKLCEECAEYITAYMKFDLNNSDTNKGLDGVFSEIADILIVVDSIKCALPSLIEQHRQEKEVKATKYLDTHIASNYQTINVEDIK